MKQATKLRLYWLASLLCLLVGTAFGNLFIIIYSFFSLGFMTMMGLLGFPAEEWSGDVTFWSDI